LHHFTADAHKVCLHQCVACRTRSEHGKSGVRACVPCRPPICLQSGKNAVVPVSVGCLHVLCIPARDVKCFSTAGMGSRAYREEHECTWLQKHINRAPLRPIAQSRRLQQDVSMQKGCEPPKAKEERSAVKLRSPSEPERSGIEAARDRRPVGTLQVCLSGRETSCTPFCS
jgi:hypothetical protein